jgi:hypothetical protein
VKQKPRTLTPTLSGVSVEREYDLRIRCTVGVEPNAESIQP